MQVETIESIITVFFLMQCVDYEYSLWGLPESSIERSKAKHEVHIRSAHKLQDLCFKNGGIYIKLGQHLSQLVSLCLLWINMKDFFGFVLRLLLRIIGSPSFGCTISPQIDELT